MSEEKQHKRRVHYSGKYPKKFEEKYKELNPEKYKDTIEHVISKGNTPAGMHISIMVKEIIDFLDIKPGQTGFDATLGYGGHTRAMLEKLEGQGHMFATDVDPIESEKTKKRLAEAGFGEDILTIKLQNFCTIDEIAKEVGGFDFILAADTAPNTARLYTNMSWFTIATPDICSVPSCPTIMLSRKLTRFVIAFWIIIGMASMR